MPVYRQNSERRNPFILSTSSAKKWPYIFLTPRLHLHVLIHVYFENCSISVYVKTPFQHETHRFRINKLRLCGPSDKGNNCNCYWIAIRISPNCFQIVWFYLKFWSERCVEFMYMKIIYIGVHMYYHRSQLSHKHIT